MPDPQNTIDLSGGLVPKSIDLSAGLQPKGAATPDQPIMEASHPGLLERASNMATEASDSPSAGASILGKTAGAVVGAVKDPVGSFAGLTDMLVNKPLNAVLPNSMQIPSAVAAVGDTEPHGAMEKAGALGSQIAQYAYGEKALSWLGKFAEAPKELHALIQQYPKAAQMFKDSFEALTEGVGAEGKIARGATLGAVQGAAQGETKNDALGGAEAGAVGGGLGAGVGEAIPAIKNTADHWLGHSITSDEAKELVNPAAKFQPAFNITKGEVLQHAADEGISLTPSQATGASGGKMVNALGERSFFGGADQLMKAKDAESYSFLNSVEQMANRLDPAKNGLSAQKAGETLQSAAEIGKDAKWRAARAGYEPLDTQYADTKVDTSAIQKKWSDELADMRTVLDNAPEGVGSKLEDVLSRGKNLGTVEKVPVTGSASTATASGPVSASYNTGTKIPTKTVVKPQLTFGDAQKLRTFFFDLGQTKSESIPKSFQAKYTELARDLSGAMDKTADAGKFSDVWKDADAGWKDYVAKYGDKSSVLNRINNADDPAKITQEILSRKSVRDIQYLKSEGLTDGLDGLKNQVIQDIANKHFRVGTKGLGDYSHEFLTELLGPDETKELYLKGEIGRSFRWQMNTSGTSNVLYAAQQVNQLEHGDVRKIVPTRIFAHASMPRPAGEFLPKVVNPAKQSITKTAVTAAGADAAEGMENQTRENNPE